MIFQTFVLPLVFLGGLGFLYILLVGGIIWLTSRKVGRERRWAVPLWLSVVSGVLFYVVGFTAFVVTASSFRYRPDVDIQSSAIIAFLILWASVLFLSYVLGYYVGRSTNVRGEYLGPTTSATVLLYMAVTVPVADFLNACLIGVPFFIAASC